ncbi:MAG: SDR family oxidoreductase [Candidatus Lokiarchaeota archaeon]|nr:SDR family oxidoreductase [Candidatus Lokiarchaeota archaeon]MBD3342144.1 SDR family oxidoreductase [Candidatus Lokiarchaeota archaeon]
MVEKFLEGKGALITGGASGFGRGFAYAYAERGADLVLVDINEELLEETSSKIASKTGKKVVPIVCDVSDSKQVKDMAKQAFEELDNIFVLNNNAGIGDPYGPNLLRLKEKYWDRLIDINLKGQWLVSKFISKKMKRQKFEPLAGKVIHTASIAGMVPDEKIPAYSIAKAGIIVMIKMLAQTLAPKVTVNALSPGYHVTGIYNDSEDAMIMTMEDGHVKTPLNRLGTVDDIVNVSVFLASPASNFITGHNFPVDGGIAETGVPAYYFDSDI